MNSFLFLSLKEDLRIFHCFLSLQNNLLAWQNEEDSDFVSTRTFDFHKLAEKFSTQNSCKRWSSDSNGLPEDFVLSKSSDPLSSIAADSDSENEDEIFLVFRGKPNNRTSSFDECQAAAGKKIIHRLKCLTTEGNQLKSYPYSIMI